MEYRIRINKKNGKDNLLCHPDKLANMLSQFGLKPHMHDGVIDFFFRDERDFSIFYEQGVSLWINRTNDKYFPELVKLMIHIANALGNGSRVVGEQGEVYLLVNYDFPTTSTVLNKSKWRLWLYRVGLLLVAIIVSFFVYSMQSMLHA